METENQLDFNRVSLYDGHHLWSCHTTYQLGRNLHGSPLQQKCRNWQKNGVEISPENFLEYILYIVKHLTGI